MIRRLALLTVLFSLALSAEPITYILSGTATGSLGTTDFTGAQFVWTGLGDTTTPPDVYPGIETQFSLAGSSISIAGLPVATFPNDPIHQPYLALSNPAFPDTAFFIVGYSSGIGFSAPAIGTWDGVSPLPLTPVTFVLLMDYPTDTDQGSLTITSVSNLQFEADTGSVPEPATWTLIALAAAGLCLSPRLRRPYP
jgi:hypothetical protein